MSDAKAKKRAHDGKLSRPAKKQKKQKKQVDPRLDTRGFVDKDGQDFQAVNLLDSDDEDLHNARVDDGGSPEGSSASEDEEARPSSKQSEPKRAGPEKKPRPARDAPTDSEEDDEDDGASSQDNSDQDVEDEDDDPLEAGSGAARKAKSKRSDPEAFATSMSKILSTKLSTSKRADPVLSRSASAKANAQAAADSALEAKARRQLRLQKKEAQDKGRVKDVLIATRNYTTGEAEESTGEMLETERRLRKVAQRGVVKLFNAVRAAQVKAAEAERENRKEGRVGIVNKGEKVNEMSRKGFLELIASGGGGLKKGPLEEA